MRDRSSVYRRRRLAQRAGSQFEWLWWRGNVKAILARVTGDDRAIHYLDDAVRDLARLNVEHLGVRPIRVDQIVGTQGRISYDKDFLPLRREDRKRWMSVAVAMMEDVTSLKPISVVQISDVYFTLDGNHRVSVARALGKLYMDADVTRWVMAPADSETAADSRQ